MKELVSTSIIIRCQAKEQLAFKLLYKACLPLVYTIISRYIKNVDLRKDIVQEVFAKVFLNIKNYDPYKGSFKSWLGKISTNQSLMFLRDQFKHFEFDDLDDHHLDTLPKPGIYKELYEDKSVLRRTLNLMPIGYSSVFFLVEMEGYSHKEVGLRLGISPDTSRSQLAKSKKWIRKHLKI